MAVVIEGVGTPVRLKWVGEAAVGLFGLGGLGWSFGFEGIKADNLIPENFSMPVVLLYYILSLLQPVSSISLWHAGCQFSDTTSVILVFVCHFCLSPVVWGI